MGSEMCIRDRFKECIQQLDVHRDVQAREERTGPGRNSNWYDPANKSPFQPKPRAVRNKNMLNFKRVGTKEAEQALQLKMKETRSTMYKEQLRVTRSEATKKLNAEARKQSNHPVQIRTG